VASLNAHLTAGTEHGRLSFHPLCPRCRDERLSGNVDSEVLISRRAQAVLAAGVLAVSTATPAVSVAAEPDQEQEGDATPTPDGGSGGTLDDPTYDPGGDDTPLDVDTGAPSEAPDGGGDADDGADPNPVESEEPDDPEGRLVLGEQPTEAPPDAGAPDSAAPPAPPKTDATGQTADPPTAAPDDDPRPGRLGEGTGGGHETTPRTVRRARAHAKHNSARPVARIPAAPNAPAPITQLAVGTVPAVSVETVPVSVPAADVSEPVTGAHYVVREGDSLWSIAKGLLGSGASNGQVAREVSRLWRLNEERIGTGDPGLLRVGTVLNLR
jgi:hypothetical protein